MVRTDMQRVFVYGTLKRGFVNYERVIAPRAAGARYVADATTVDAYPLFVDVYKVPYLVHRPGAGSRIAGELFEVDDATLAALDVLEGYPDRYDRLKIGVDLDDSPSPVDAWLYALRADTRDLAWETRDLIPAYTRAIHADFVPPGDGRDAALRRAWGGYEV
mmetsp:Transcript_6689/g.21099  ORF Transcript_6689/g.21099 Transcript_6689/m.21099 type:complete len:162 (-) Transcript_6689:60-545(-)